MTSRDLGIVGIRLVGLTAIVQAVQAMPTVFGMMALSSNFDEGPEPAALVTLLPGAIWVLGLVAVGVTIIAYAPTIGGRLFPADKPVAWSIGAEELRVVLFSAIGALILVESLPAVLRDVVALALYSNQGWEAVGGGILGENGLQLGTSLLTAILGAFLLLGGRGVAAGVGRLRRAGTGGYEPETDQDGTGVGEAGRDTE